LNQVCGVELGLRRALPRGGLGHRTLSRFCHWFPYAPMTEVSSKRGM
jgi:hypothetical protein